MQISISGHHVSVTPALKQSIYDKLAKVERHFDHINSMQVILSLDNHHTEKTHKGQQNHKAEAILRVPGTEIFAHASEDDMYASIAKMADKLDRQIRRYKTKLKSHQATSLATSFAMDNDIKDKAETKKETLHEVDYEDESYTMDYPEAS